MARDEGITDREIGAAQAVVMAVSAGRIRAQFREVRAKAKRGGEKSADGGEGGCSC